MKGGGIIVLPITKAKGVSRLKRDRQARIEKEEGQFMNFLPLQKKGG